MEDDTHKFLYDVGKSDVVMLPFSSFLGKVSTEGQIPMTDILGSIVERIT